MVGCTDIDPAAAHAEPEVAAADATVQLEDVVAAAQQDEDGSPCSWLALHSLPDLQTSKYAGLVRNA